MPSRVNSQDKLISIVSFAINSQHIFTLIANHNFLDELKTRFSDSNTGKLKGISKRLRQDFLKKFFDSDVEYQVYKKNKELADKKLSERSEWINQTGLSSKEFQKWGKECLESYIKEFDKKVKRGNKPSDKIFKKK